MKVDAQELFDKWERGVNMTITYYEHKANKELFQGLETYLNSEYPKDENGVQNIPTDILKYSNYLKEHFVQNPKPLLSYYEDDDDIKAEDDMRYPSEDFLISLAEANIEPSKEDYDKVLDLIERAWYKIDDSEVYVDSQGWYCFYTFGWSGNEDILTALFHNLNFCLFFKHEYDKECTALCRIKYRFGDKSKEDKKK